MLSLNSLQLSAQYFGFLIAVKLNTLSALDEKSTFL